MIVYWSEDDGALYLPAHLDNAPVDGRLDALEECADELEALLAAGGSVAPCKHQWMPTCAAYGQSACRTYRGYGPAEGYCYSCGFPEAAHKKGAE